MNFAENLARSITAPVTNTLAAGIMGKSEFVILDQSGHVMACYNAPKTGGIYLPTVSAEVNLTKIVASLCPEFES